MPSRKIHNLINRLILGKNYNDVNRFIDLPYLWLGGRHRKYFHDLKTTPALIALIKKDLRAGLAAVLHILADRTFKNKK